MNLNNKFKVFKFGSLIGEIYKGKAINKDELSESQKGLNSIRYITRTGDDNGCEMLADLSGIEEEYIEEGNAISIGDTTATCFYQDERFITGDHIVVIRAKRLNYYTGMYITTLLNNEQYRYSYGRAFVKDKIKNTELLLPADMNGNPDWEFMESFVKSLKSKTVTTCKIQGIQNNIDTNKWKEFTVSQLFQKIEKGKCGDASSLIEGSDINYIGAKRDNNGVMKMCSYKDNKDLISKGNCVVMIGQGQGSSGYAIYLDKDFIGASSLNIGYADRINKYTALFVVSVLCLEYDKYSFGRSWTGDRLKNTIVKLPVNLNGDPDWEFMENYIKNLPYGDRI